VIVTVSCTRIPRMRCTGKCRLENRNPILSFDPINFSLFNYLYKSQVSERYFADAWKKISLIRRFSLKLQIICQVVCDFLHRDINNFWELNLTVNLRIRYEVNAECESIASFRNNPFGDTRVCDCIDYHTALPDRTIWGSNVDPTTSKKRRKRERVA